KLRREGFEPSSPNATADGAPSAHAPHDVYSPPQSVATNDSAASNRSGAYMLFSEPVSTSRSFSLGVEEKVKGEEVVDFGPYMADLQRRIKRAWFPPKGNETKRVVLVFKVHSGGELSHLKLDKTSGLAIADEAAMKAVENAAPFHPLPNGAPKVVDIQFTFDYNVFVGNGHGQFRQF